MQYVSVCFILYVSVLYVIESLYSLQTKFLEIISSQRNSDIGVNLEKVQLAYKLDPV